VSSGTSTPPSNAEQSGDRIGLESAAGSRGKGLVAILGSFFTTLPGLLVGVAAVGTAFFGGTQLSSQPAPTVTVTATATATVTASAPVGPATPGSTATAAPSSPQAPSSNSSTSAAPAVQSIELAALTPLQSTNVDGLTTAQSQQVGPKTYANAVRFSCSDPQGNFNELVYKVVGYTAFDATFGVPDDASNGTGNSATITFYKDGGSTQMGKSFTVALDNPHHVHLDLRGTSQLEIDCTAANQYGFNGDDIDIAIVNGTLSK
jgi:hypothetical protein